MILDESGNIKNTYNYDAWGNITSKTETIPNPIRYAGEYQDEETGLYYLRNRYYDPKLGRFTQEDPTRDGTNWYIYCGDNPLRYTDPLGLKPGDRFDSPDETVADFGLFIGQTSIDLEEEFFSFIFTGSNDDGTAFFFYDDPRNDYETHEERMTGFMFNNFNSNAVAISHTHGAYDANTGNTKDGFSSPGNSLDANFTDTSEADRFGVNYYVVTPVGNLYRYDANSGNFTGTLIKTNMPVDSRITIHQHIKNTFVWNLLLSNFPNGTSQDYVNARRNNPDSLLDTILALERFR